MFQAIRIFAKFFIAAIPFISERITSALRARIHHHTFQAVPSPLNIVIIGGSFGGLYLATELANAIPTGYRVVLIEKNSHFNFTWLFPRVSVVEGHEHKAFIPYGPGITKLPAGSLLLRKATAVEVDEKSVTLEDGTVIAYEYLALATGSTGTAPWRSNVATGDKGAGMRMFREMQADVKEAKDLVVVGGGAVGVELAADAKSKWPEKRVSLVHSRERLLGSFGGKLHEHAMKALKELGVDVYVGERVPEGAGKQGPETIVLKDGRSLPCDLLIRCTGQRAASDILSTLSPSSISTSGTILVQKTLQIIDSKLPKIYALGDVAETSGVRMGRAAAMQAVVVASNILRAIKGREQRAYKPIALLESGIDLTLGLTKGVLYLRDGEEEFLMQSKKGIALDSKEAWKMNGAQPFDDVEYDKKRTE